MSLISDYRNTKAAIEDLQAKLAQLEGSEELKKEVKFEEELRELFSRHGKSLKDAIAILDPALAAKLAGKSTAVPVERTARRVKRYQNPNTGEVVETKGGNHKTIKEWKAKHGADVVESWASYQ